MSEQRCGRCDKVFSGPNDLGLHHLVCSVHAWSVEELSASGRQFYHCAHCKRRISVGVGELPSRDGCGQVEAPWNGYDCERCGQPVFCAGREDRERGELSHRPHCGGLRLELEQRKVAALERIADKLAPPRVEFLLPGPDDDA
jgi:DNA-directed RNA polymerase subunit RPC12/RpoP